MALTDKLTAIGDAIREKNGATELIPLADMPQAILDIVSGGTDIQYKSIVYNADDTISLTDKDGVVHTMKCTYENDKLIGVTFDGTDIRLTYDGDVLVKVGRTLVDLGEMLVGGNETDPYIDMLYSKYGISKEEYPDCIFSPFTVGAVMFCATTKGGFVLEDNENGFWVKASDGGYWTTNTLSIPNETDTTNPVEILKALINAEYGSIPYFSSISKFVDTSTGKYGAFYTNTDLTTEGEAWVRYGG